MKQVVVNVEDKPDEGQAGEQAHLKAPASSLAASSLETVVEKFARSTVAPISAALALLGSQQAEAISKIDLLAPQNQSHQSQSQAELPVTEIQVTKIQAQPRNITLSEDGYVTQIFAHEQPAPVSFVGKSWAEIRQQIANKAAQDPVEAAKQAREDVSSVSVTEPPAPEVSSSADHVASSELEEAEVSIQGGDSVVSIDLQPISSTVETLNFATANESLGGGSVEDVSKPLDLELDSSVGSAEERVGEESYFSWSDLKQSDMEAADLENPEHKDGDTTRIVSDESEDSIASNDEQSFESTAAEELDGPDAPVTEAVSAQVEEDFLSSFAELEVSTEIDLGSNTDEDDEVTLDEAFDLVDEAPEADAVDEEDVIFLYALDGKPLSEGFTSENAVVTETEEGSLAVEGAELEVATITEPNTYDVLEEKNLNVDNDSVGLVGVAEASTIEITEEVRESSPSESLAAEILDSEGTALGLETVAVEDRSVESASGQEEAPQAEIEAAVSEVYVLNLDIPEAEVASVEEVAIPSESSDSFADVTNTEVTGVEVVVLEPLASEEVAVASEEPSSVTGTELEVNGSEVIEIEGQLEGQGLAQEQEILEETVSTEIVLEVSEPTLIERELDTLAAAQENNDEVISSNEVSLELTVDSEELRDLNTQEVSVDTLEQETLKIVDIADFVSEEVVSAAVSESEPAVLQEQEYAFVPNEEITAEQDEDKALIVEIELPEVYTLAPVEDLNVSVEPVSGNILEDGFVSASTEFVAPEIEALAVTQQGSEDIIQDEGYTPLQDNSSQGAVEALSDGEEVISTEFAPQVVAEFSAEEDAAYAREAVAKPLESRLLFLAEHEQKDISEDLALGEDLVPLEILLPLSLEDSSDRVDAHEGSNEEVNSFGQQEIVVAEEVNAATQEQGWILDITEEPSLEVSQPATFDDLSFKPDMSDWQVSDSESALQLLSDYQSSALAIGEFDAGKWEALVEQESVASAKEEVQSDEDFEVAPQVSPVEIVLGDSLSLEERLEFSQAEDLEDVLVEGTPVPVRTRKSGRASISSQSADEMVMNQGVFGLLKKMLKKKADKKEADAPEVVEEDAAPIA